MDGSTSPNTIRLRPSPKRTERASLSLSPGGRTSKRTLRSRASSNVDAMDIDSPDDDDHDDDDDDDDDEPQSPGRALRTRKSFSYDLTVRRKKKDEQPDLNSAPTTPKKATPASRVPKSEPKRRQSARLVTIADNVKEQQPITPKTAVGKGKQTDAITARGTRSANAKLASARTKTLAASRPKRVIPTLESSSESESSKEEDDEDDSSDEEEDSDDDSSENSDSDSDDSEKEKEDEEPQVPKKKWATHGLYVGQNQQIVGRSTLRALKKGGKAERTLLPLPMYKGMALMETEEDFVLPFNVFNLSPWLIKKPPGWKQLRRNVFVGEAFELWRHKQKQAANKSDHTACACSKATGCDSRCLNRIMYYECDTKNCNFPDCKNRPFRDLAVRTEKKKKFHDGLELIMTKDKGYGLRATRSFEPNQIIVEYCGEIITQDECDDRMNTKYKDNESYYLMEFDNSMIIDATRGSVARFVNHSCSPNCKMEKWIVSGKPRMALFAGDDGVEVGEELTYDYNFNWFSGVSTQQCRCRSENCRGQVGKRSDAKKLSPPALDKNSAKSKGKGKAAAQAKGKAATKKPVKVIKKKVVKASNAKVIRKTAPKAKPTRAQPKKIAATKRGQVVKKTVRGAVSKARTVRMPAKATVKAVSKVTKKTTVTTPKATPRKAQAAKTTPAKKTVTRAKPSTAAEKATKAKTTGRVFKVGKAYTKRVVTARGTKQPAKAMRAPARKPASPAKQPRQRKTMVEKVEAVKPSARGGRKKTAEENTKEILKPRTTAGKNTARVNPKALNKAVEAELPKPPKGGIKIPRSKIVAKARRVTVIEKEVPAKRSRKSLGDAPKSPRKAGSKVSTDTEDVTKTPSKRISRSIWDFTERPRVKRSPRTKKITEATLSKTSLAKDKASPAKKSQASTVIDLTVEERPSRTPKGARGFRNNNDAEVITMEKKTRRKSEPVVQEKRSRKSAANAVQRVEQEKAVKVASPRSAKAAKTGAVGSGSSPAEKTKAPARNSISSDSFYGNPKGVKRGLANDEPAASQSPKRARTNSDTTNGRKRHSLPLTPTQSANSSTKSPRSGSTTTQTLNTYQSRKRSDVMSNTPSSRSSSNNGENCNGKEERLSKKRSFEAVQTGRVLSGGQQAPLPNGFHKSPKDSDKSLSTPTTIPQSSFFGINSEPPQKTGGWNAVNRQGTRFSGFLGFFSGTRDKEKGDSPQQKDLAVKKASGVLETIRVGAGLL